MTTTTPTQTRTATVRWTSGTNLAAGLWLIAAQFLLAYSDVGAAVWNDVLVGLAVLGLAWYRTARPARHTEASWTNAALGAWLIAAPFALGYADVSAAVGTTSSSDSSSPAWPRSAPSPEANSATASVDDTRHPGAAVSRAAAPVEAQGGKVSPMVDCPAVPAFVGATASTRR